MSDPGAAPPPSGPVLRPAPTPYCSARCRATPLVRSFSACPHCGCSWNGQAEGTERHYRNNAWRLCDSCARRERRCVVCAGPLNESGEG